MSDNKDKPKSNPSNPKLDKFLEEINKLGEKYQYKIVPVLRYGNDGIIPSISIVDTVPQDTKPTNGENNKVPEIKGKN